jgi:ribosome-binding factor A
MIMERMDRINQFFKREISSMILMGEIRDPRVAQATITYVDVSKDLSWAHVGFSILSDKPEDIKNVQQGLKSASGAVRRLLGQRVTLRHIPEVKFVYDSTLSQSVHMTSTLDALAQERIARGVDPAAEQQDDQDEQDEQDGKE